MRLPVLLLLFMAGCSPAGENASEIEVRKLRAELDASRTSEQIAKEALAEHLSKGTASASPVAAGANDPPSEHSEPENEGGVERCWQDYCPCDEDGDMDRILCRNLRGGLEVDADMMAAGAASRDARQSMARWNRDNPDMAVPQ